MATARRIDRLNDLAAEIADTGRTCLPVQLDVTDADQITSVVATAEDYLGPVQILVNNAGIPDAQYATKMPLELIDQVLDTNLRAPFLLSCEVARRLIDAGAARDGSSTSRRSAGSTTEAAVRRCTRSARRA